MTASTNYRNQLCALLVSCFSNILESSRFDDRQWRKLQEGISRHGLLTTTVSIPRRSRLPQIDEARLETDRKYRRQIARHLLKPQGPDFQQVVVPLERVSLSDPTYLKEMSELLAERWTDRLLSDRPDVVARLVLLHSTPETLAESLERLFRYQATSRDASARMMARFAQEEIDRSEEVQAVFAELDVALDEVEQRASSEFDEIGKRMVSDVSDALACIQASADAKFDALQQRFRG